MVNEPSVFEPLNFYLIKVLDRSICVKTEARKPNYLKELYVTSLTHLCIVKTLIVLARLVHTQNAGLMKSQIHFDSVYGVCLIGPATL